MVADNRHSRKWSSPIGTDLIELEDSDYPFSLENATLVIHCTQWRFSYLELSVILWTALSIEDKALAEVMLRNTIMKPEVQAGYF